MRVTSKGQVTVPKRIRDRMGIMPGTEVEFRIEKGVVTLKKMEDQDRRGQMLLNRMKGRATAMMSTDDIMALTRGE